jgi:Tol biopolymer transport system component
MCRFAFVSHRNGSFAGEIYVMDAADGSGQLNLTVTPTSPSELSPAWSPDGTLIAFTQRDSFVLWDIYVMNASDGSDRAKPHQRSPVLGRPLRPGRRMVVSCACGSRRG